MMDAASRIEAVGVAIRKLVEETPIQYVGWCDGVIALVQEHERLEKAQLAVPELKELEKRVALLEARVMGMGGQVIRS